MGADDRDAVLSEDTAAAAERVQIEAWRRMTFPEKAQLTADASRSVRRLAFAGLRARHPGASESELVARYAELTLGRSLALEAYPELESLDPTSTSSLPALCSKSDNSTVVS